MRRIVFIALVALIALLPTGAGAQQRAQPEASTAFLGMTPGQALAVGVGIVAGAVVLNALMPGPWFMGTGLTTAVGGLAGALIGNWTYWWVKEPAPRAGVRGAAAVEREA
ncbi:MAG: hypothetical protein ACT4P2_11075 [Pseudomonadota bacterium]